MRQLIANGRVERGWFGVTTEPLTPEAARQMGLEARGGALIADVAEGGPAANAGVRRGQVVVGFNGEAVDSDLDLRNRVAAARPGEVLSLRVFADGQVKDLSVTIGDLSAVSAHRIALAEGRLGISVREVTLDESKLYRLSPASGVVVTAIRPDGPFAAHGLEVGDVVVEIQGHGIENPEMFGIVAMLLPPGAEVSLLAVDHRTGEAGYLKVLIR
jgi:serine protease Do